MIFNLQIFHVANASFLIPSLMKAFGWFPLIKAFLVFLWREKRMEKDPAGRWELLVPAALGWMGSHPCLGPWNVGIVEAGNLFSPNFGVYSQILMFTPKFWCLQKHCWAGEGGQVISVVWVQFENLFWNFFSFWMVWIWSLNEIYLLVGLRFILL